MNKFCCFQNTSSQLWKDCQLRLKSSSPPLRFDIPILKTSQELWMLSSVTINCQVTMIDWIQVLNRQNCNRCLKCQVSQTVLQMVKICLNIIKMQKVLKVLKSHKIMSPHHSDQMPQWPQVSRIILCMAKVKVSEWVSQSVSEWQGHLLSCSGQLKKPFMSILYANIPSKSYKICPKNFEHEAAIATLIL